MATNENTLNTLTSLKPKRKRGRPKKTKNPPGRPRKGQEKKRLIKPPAAPNSIVNREARAEERSRIKSLVAQPSVSTPAQFESPIVSEELVPIKVEPDISDYTFIHSSFIDNNPLVYKGNGESAYN